MFDWNDEEIVHIIWGEEDGNDDHIVPYQEEIEDYHSKKEWNQEAMAMGPTEQKTVGTKIDTHGEKLASSSNNANGGIPSSRFHMDSWTDLSLSNAMRDEPHLRGIEVSNGFTEVSKHYSPRETAQIEKDTENIQNAHGNKGESGLVCGWDNIGSLDDLDQIFRNDDSLFGRLSPSNVEDLWSSKDLSSSPIKSFSFPGDSANFCSRNMSEHLEVKTEYIQHDDKPFSRCTKTRGSSSQALHDVHSTVDCVYYAEGKSTGQEPCLDAENVSPPIKYSDKIYQQGKVLKERRRQGEKFVGNILHPSGSSSGNMSILSRNQPAASTVNQQHYRHITNPFVACSPYAMPVLSHIQSGYENPPHNESPTNESPNHLVKYPTMTPQEKIEKLRRQQQMRAMLAIQKQKQQISHQIPSTGWSISEECAPENQLQHFDGVDVKAEDPSTLPSLELNSLLEQVDSTTLSAAVEYSSVEDTVFYQLQDLIAKLDIRIKLIIRDSLFRLAQSAMQRRNAYDTSSTNKICNNGQGIAAEHQINSHDRCCAEKVTNETDRIVAHLLFHRKLEISENIFPERELQSSKLSCEHEDQIGSSLSDNIKPIQDSSYLTFSISSRPIQSQCIDTVYNASHENEERDTIDDKEQEVPKEVL